MLPESSDSLPEVVGAAGIRISSVVASAAAQAAQRYLAVPTGHHSSSTHTMRARRVMVQKIRFAMKTRGSALWRGPALARGQGISAAMTGREALWP